VGGEHGQQQVLRRTGLWGARVRAWDGPCWSPSTAAGSCIMFISGPRPSINTVIFLWACLPFTRPTQLQARALNVAC
jgi:hypothetical protein